MRIPGFLNGTDDLLVRLKGSIRSTETVGILLDKRFKSTSTESRKRNSQSETYLACPVPQGVPAYPFAEGVRQIFSGEILMFVLYLECPSRGDGGFSIDNGVREANNDE